MQTTGERIFSCDETRLYATQPPHYFSWSSSTPNIEPRTVIVNGNSRIGFFAKHDIDAQSEVSYVNQILIDAAVLMNILIVATN